MMRLVPLFALFLLGCPPTLSRPSPRYEADLAAAERAAAHGRDGEAAALFATAAESADRRVDRDEARYRRARALEDEGRIDEALAELEAIATTTPPSRRTARALFDAAKLRIRHDGDRARADAELRRVVLEFSEHGVASRALHWMLRERDASGQLALIDELDPLVGETELGDNLLMRRTEILLERQERQAARATLEKLVERHPYPFGEYWDEAVLMLAELDVEDGDVDGAIARLEAMLERSEDTNLSGSYTLPNFPVAHLRIAELHRQRGRSGEAARWYSSLAGRYPTCRLRDDALLGLATLRFDEGDDEAACETLSELVEEFEVGHARREGQALRETRCANSR